MEQNRYNRDIRGVCHTCNKYTYQSRRSARRTRSKLTDHLDVYWCPVNTGWHIGHPPKQRKHTNRTDHHPGCPG